EVVGAHQLRSGAVVLHLKTAEAADCLRAKKRMDAFLEGMGGTAVHKLRSYSVVLEFMPVTFDPALDNVLHAVEDANGFERGAITQARYIKPMGRRHAVHRVAHMIFGFATADGANHVI
ncbi:hypothetical protein C8R45DRAFT_780198, partial [Mycena sanguinolenta]